MAACPAPMRSAAARISSLMCASVVCARSGAAPLSNVATAPSATVRMRFRVIPSLLLPRLLVPRSPAILVPLVVDLVELHPLIGRQHLPHAQQLQRPRLVQTRSNRFDLVHLP